MLADPKSWHFLSVTRYYIFGHETQQHPHASSKQRNGARRSPSPEARKTSDEVQQALATTLLGGGWRTPELLAGCDEPPLALALAEADTATQARGLNAAAGMARSSNHPSKPVQAPKGAGEKTKWLSAGSNAVRNVVETWCSNSATSPWATPSRPHHGRLHPCVAAARKAGGGLGALGRGRAGASGRLVPAAAWFQRPPGSSRLPWPQALPAGGGRRASAPGSVAACAAMRLAVLPHQHRPPAHGRSVRGLTSYCEGGHERGVATQRLAQKRGSEIQAPAVICSHPLRVGVHQPMSRDYRPIESICLLCGIFPTCC